MLFDLKPGRVALVFVDEVGVITGSVPGAMELLAPFPGLPAFLGAWSKEWGTGAGESLLQAREIPGEGERSGIRLEAARIVPSKYTPSGPNIHGPHRLLVCIRFPEEHSSRLTKYRDRFGFTRAECRVAADAAEGLAPAEIARRLGLSVQTVRSHLKRIFMKAGVHSQGGLVKALLDDNHNGHGVRRPGSSMASLKP